MTDETAETRLKGCEPPDDDVVSRLRRRLRRLGISDGRYKSRVVEVEINTRGKNPRERSCSLSLLGTTNLYLQGPIITCGGDLGVR